MYNDYQNRVPPDVLNMIDSVTLNEININELVPFNNEENERLKLSK